MCNFSRNILSALSVSLLIAAPSTAAAQTSTMSTTIGSGDNAAAKEVEKYVPGQTDWSEFIADGWFEKAPQPTTAGLLKAEGVLDDLLQIVLGIYKGDASQITGATQEARSDALAKLNEGQAVKYYPVYTSTVDEMMKYSPFNCIFLFEKRKLIQKKCLNL